MNTARLESIWVAPAAGEELRSLTLAEVEKGRGIIGDRYHQGAGTFSRWQRGSRAISLIESESLACILEDSAIDLSQGRSRRNLVTSGIRLRDLIGGRFQIGSALFRASATCPPCRYLERLLGLGTFASLRNRGGIRAEVIESGTFCSGSAIVPLGEKVRLP